MAPLTSTVPKIKGCDVMFLLLPSLVVEELTFLQPESSVLGASTFFLAYELPTAATASELPNATPTLSEIALASVGLNLSCL